MVRTVKATSAWLFLVANDGLVFSPLRSRGVMIQKVCRREGAGNSFKVGEPEDSAQALTAATGH